MANSIDTLIDDIVSDADSLVTDAVNLLHGTSLSAQPATLTVAPVVYPTHSSYSVLDGIPEPVANDLLTALNGMIASVQQLYARYWPSYAVDLANRESVSAALHRILGGNEFVLGHAIDRAELVKDKMDLEMPIAHRHICDKWAALGYMAAPGQLSREITEDYTARAAQVQDARVSATEDDVGALLPQYTSALQQLLDQASRSRAAAIAASTDLIRAAAAQASIPSKQFASLVSVRAATAEVLEAKFNADRAFDERLLSVYAGNMGLKGLLNQYNASIHQRQTGNMVSAAVGEAEAIGQAAASLWNAINAIASASTITFS